MRLDGRLAARGLLAAMLASLGLGVAIGLWSLLRGRAEPALMPVVPTSFLVAAYLALMLGAVSLMRRVALMRRDVLVAGMVLALLLAVVSAGCWLVMIWWQQSLRNSELETLARMGGSTLAVAVALVHTGCLGLIVTRTAFLRWMRRVIVLIAWTFVVLLMLILWFVEAMEYVLPQVVLILALLLAGVLGASALVAPLLLRGLSAAHERRFRAQSRAVSASLRLQMTCPRCGADLALPLGPGRCAACGFTMTIEIEEPRCACGYLLFGLHGTTCPECGADVSPEQRWVRGRGGSEAPEGVAADGA